MLVHAVVALAPLAAISFALEARALTISTIVPQTWAFLLRGSLIGILVLAVPATVSGITERNHMYTNWPPSHRAKLVLSFVLVVMVSAEIVGLWTGSGGRGLISWLGLAIVAGNNAVALALSYYGLRITLGRQSIGSTSYVPDMDREPPFDILDVVAEHAHEAPKMIDIQKEGGE